jgi:hypothetical protein
MVGMRAATISFKLSVIGAFFDYLKWLKGAGYLKTNAFLSDGASIQILPPRTHPDFILAEIYSPKHVTYIRRSYCHEGPYVSMWLLFH